LKYFFCKNLVTVAELEMPLAQNYINDVSLVESEAHLTKTTMDTESDAQQRFLLDPNNVS
jgi:hypothetical protein